MVSKHAKGEHNDKLIEMTDLHHILRCPFNKRQIKLKLILLEFSGLKHAKLRVFKLTHFQI